MLEVVISDKTYRVGKLNAMQQFHVARRLAPALWALGVAAQSAEKAVSLTDTDSLLALEPVAESISKMSDSEVDYVLQTCLSVVSRQESKGWAKVQASNGGLMFEDIDMSTMMQLTFTVIRENLGNFFPGQPGTQSQ